MAVVILAQSACSKAQTASPPAPAPSGVVAEVHGRAINAAELDERAAQRLLPLRQQEYDVRREVLDQMIADRLFETEAAARGVTVQALLQAEVLDKLPAPDPAQMRLVYEQNRGRVGGRSFDEVRPQIEAALREQALQQRREAFRKELAGKAGVKLRLSPPRFEVPLPARPLGTGPASAPVTLVAYSDYQCPYCRSVQHTLDELLTRYDGKLRMVVRDFPLDFHARALPAAVAARCAAEQDRFWEYHRSLLTLPGDLGEADLKARAAALGLRAEPFGACLPSGRYDAAIQESLAEGQRIGVGSTPTLFVNGRMLTGAQPLERFAQVIDEELAAAR